MKIDDNLRENLTNWLDKDPCKICTHNPMSMCIFLLYLGSQRLQFAFQNAGDHRRMFLC